MPTQNAPAEKFGLRDLGAVAAVRTSQAGILYGISILNAAGATAFVQLFDVATAGAVSLGTTTPDYEFSIATATSAVIALPTCGVRFRYGIQAASSTAEKGATPSASGLQAFFLVI